MDPASFLNYPDSLTALGEENPDFGTDWTADREASYNLDSCRIPCAAHEGPMADNRLDSDGQGTVITESMSVTVSDEEKLLLLNKNTELRRLNNELMKLNKQWDEIYRSTTQSLQHTACALQDQVLSLTQQRDKLSMKLEHEQNKREFYETSLLQEMKTNQKLQEYVRHLESTLHYSGLSLRGAPTATDVSKSHSQSDISPTRPSIPLLRPLSCNGGSEDLKERAEPAPGGQDPTRGSPTRRNSRGPQNTRGQRVNMTETNQDMSQLKDQLKALKCQTEMYAADFKTEHTDRQRIRTENDKLRQKERDMREQMLLLQEQLKIYEDDFRKERSDKQILQRLLKSRASLREPVLVHRCNNGPDQKGVLRDIAGSRKQRESDGEGLTPPYCIGY
ncbi:uncharacterized protein LOC142467389 isoform X2 [Ascaphus truei]|uniref:uncharacterized protein LOC142467389 isoform X2 n=1 Tax=Ascaphus truei TaxID=8439 RepID=UPI003F5A77AF